jgi:FkbM family methyltransferase
MRRIFLDLGAWDGTSTKFFRKHHPQGNEYEVFCFEPLPENIEKLKAMHEVWNINIIASACDIENGKAMFYTGLSESGSLMEEKRSGGLDGETGIEVKTFDFVDWLFELVSEDTPEIILKMNIEGTEYRIIDKLYRCGLILYVKKWYVQWHYEKIGLHKEVHEAIKELIPEERLFSWGAMFKDWEKTEEWQRSLRS